MFRFREFRLLCKEGKSKDIIEMMSKRLSLEEFDNYFLCCKYISGLINKNALAVDPELLNFLYSFPSYTTPQINFTANSRKIGIFLKNPDCIPPELYSCINRIYKTPLVILIGETQLNTDYAEYLNKSDTAAKIINYSDDLNKQLEIIKLSCEEEGFSKIILQANPADLDFMLICRKYEEESITFHRTLPLIGKYTYCEQDDSLGKGSWCSNKGLPLYDHYSAIYIPKGQSFPELAFEKLKHEKLILLNPEPLECLKFLNDGQIEKIIFIKDPLEYHTGLKFCSELMVVEGAEQICFDLAMEWGLALNFLQQNKILSYQEVQRKLGLRNRFTQVLSNVLKTKMSYRKSLPRILFFRNDKSAPIIASINQNISAALKHANCPILEVDLTEMVNASSQNDWTKLKSIQQNLRDQIDHFQAEHALGYNATGIFPNGDSHMLEQIGIPYTGLFFDNPFYFMDSLKFCKNKAMLNILTLDEFYINPLKEGGFSNTHYLPIATSLHNRSKTPAHIFDPGKFIFTSTVKPVYSAESIAGQLNNKNDKDFIHYALNEIINNECYSISSLLNSYKHFYSKDYIRFQNEIWFKIDNQCSSQLRLKTIEALGEYEVDIYGGDNWKNIELSPLHTYKGYMNYNMLADAYKTAFGSICRTPLNIQNGIQQRILDCGAAQGLIISDYRPILEEHFDLDKELFVYRNCDELKEKVKFLKNNPNALEKSKKLLNKKVLEQHTWDIRVQELINYMM